MKNYKIPVDIEKEAKEYIKNVLNELEKRNVLENIDSAAITMLARNYSMFIKASKAIEKDGLTIESDRGNLTPHPAIKIAKDAQTQAMKVMMEFGLTAKARTKLPSIIKDEEEDTPFEQFIKSAKETR